MTRRHCGVWPLALVLLLLTPWAPLAPAQAQGTRRTFPETGKTVEGRFLQYWTEHGGLAQQGFPITEEIQETSATNGQIYTVQYFERAVFEHHPENTAPNDVLLQLLGVFLYHQKYPQGAPGQTPNTEAGSRLFPQTGQRLGGIFLQYWTTHGGLAQQGYPISNEFMEKSDLNGNLYRVQYFERAVFEYHPENQPPYNVLLSQLGTFRRQAKYGATLAQLSGTGNQMTAPVTLQPGWAVIQSVRASAGGYYYISALDAQDQDRGTVATGNGPNDESVPMHIAAAGQYRFQVQAEDGWTINVSQPVASYTPPPAHQEWRGHGWQASPLFALHAGAAHFHAVSPNDKAGSTKSPARVDLLDQDGLEIGSFAEGSDPIDATADLNIPRDGVYILRIYFNQADWTITVDQ